jgi:hypothetical protein
MVFLFLLSFFNMIWFESIFKITIEASYKNCANMHSRMYFVLGLTFDFCEYCYYKIFMFENNMLKHKIQ